MDNLIEQIDVLKQKRSGLKTKVARSKVTAKIQDIETQVYKILGERLKQYGPASVKGTCLYSSEGDLMIRTPYGLVHSNVCNDVKSVSWYDTTSCISYAEGQDVIVHIKFEVDFDRYCIKVVTGKIEGGTFDEAEYQRLSQRKDLAFFRYPNGSMSGLFSEGV